MNTVDPVTGGFPSYRAARRSAASSRICQWVPAALIVAVSAFYLLFVVDSGWHQQWDSGTYLVTARNLAAGRGYTLFDQPFFARPPGFAYFLSWFVGTEGDFHFGSLNLLMAAVALAALVPIYFVFRHVAGESAAFAASLLFATCPLFVSQFNLILSDPLFLLLFFSVVWLLLASEADGDEQDWKGWAAAVVLAASIYVRTIGVGLIPGLIVRGLRLKGRKRVLALSQVALVAALLIPLVMYTRNASATAPRPATQLFIFDYATTMIHQDPGDPDSPLRGPRAWVSRSESNLKDLVLDLGRNLVHSRRILPRRVAALLVAAGFLLVVWRRGVSLLEWWALGCGAILVLYFTYSSRLVLPFAPLFSYYFIVVLSAFAQAATGLFGRPRFARAVVVVPVVAILTLNLMFWREYIDPRYKPNQERGSVVWHANEAAAEWIKLHTPADAVILHRTPATFEALAHRHALGYQYLRGRPVPSTDYAVFIGPVAEFETRFRETNLGSWALRSPSYDVRIYRLR